MEGKTAKMQRKQLSQEKRASLLIQNAIKCNNPESMEELNAYLKNTEKYKMDGTPLPLSGGYYCAWVETHYHCFFRG